mgnify:CR=1 FL=1
MIALLASEHDGEALAAARALVRIAKSSKKKIEEFIAPMGQGPAHTSSHFEKSNEEHQRDDFISKAMESRRVSWADRILQKTMGSTILNSSDRDFLLEMKTMPIWRSATGAQWVRLFGLANRAGVK